jgi:hypothetical protein
MANPNNAVSAIVECASCGATAATVAQLQHTRYCISRGGPVVNSVTTTPTDPPVAQEAAVKTK